MEEEEDMIENKNKGQKKIWISIRFLEEDKDNKISIQHR